MEVPVSVKYPVVVGPNPQPDIRKAETVIIGGTKYKVLVDKDNPSFASVWTETSGQPSHVYYHLLEPSVKAVTTDNLAGNRDPVFTCLCHNMDSIYRPGGVYQCEHILAAIATGKMEPRDHTNKSYPKSTAHVP